MDTNALVLLAQANSRDSFVARLPHAFLVLDEDLRAQEIPVGFATRMAPSRPQGNPPSPRITDVRAVIKAAGNPYPERVSVGRARNCDIVIRHASVSKLHAHFHIGGARLEVADVASHNGTRVNGRPLPPHQQVAVSTGDIIVFGSIFAKLLDAATLYDLLRNG